MGNRQGILDEQDLRTLEHIGISTARKLEKSIERTAKDTTRSSKKERDPVDALEREVKHSAKIAAKTFTKSVSLSRDWGKDIGTKEWEKEY